MQCASSTASSETPTSRSRSAVVPKSNRSGARYSSFTSPRVTRAMRSEISPEERVLFTKVAAMPRAVSASTWSFIREINGLMTTVSPGSTSAGIW